MAWRVSVGDVGEENVMGDGNERRSFLALLRLLDCFPYCCRVRMYPVIQYCS